MGTAPAALRALVLALALARPRLAGSAGAGANASGDGGVWYVRAELGGTLGGLRRRSLGAVVIAVHPEWAPLGAAHFRTLVRPVLPPRTRFARALLFKGTNLAWKRPHNRPPPQIRYLQFLWSIRSFLLESSFSLYCAQ